MRIFNRKNQKNFRKHLRNNPTEAEARLWYFLRDNKIMPFKFRRQYGIGKYVVDFYCPAKKLVVEVDGDSHFEEKQIEYDKLRDQYLKSLGIRILRFNNTDVYDNVEAVIDEIMDTIVNHP